MYAAATMASAFALPWVGRYIDSAPIARFSLGVFVGLILACTIMYFSVHPLVILPGFFLLRFFGQGLMSHTSISTMARAFDGDRGKAVSLATLGHPLGEAILPVSVALGISQLGWQSMFLLTGGIVLVVLLPSALLLIRNFPAAVQQPVLSQDTDRQTKKNPFRVLKKRAFWIISPTVFILGFLNTAIFFFQIKLGASKGWSAAWVAASLSAFAVASAAGMMLSGPLVDKVSARRLFPYILVMYILGILILATQSHPVSYPAALVLLAISNGAGSTIKNSLFAEVFGTSIIGSVRSVFTTAMVFSTALGPVTFGLLLDAGLSFESIFFLFALVLAVIMVWSFQLKSLS